MTWFRTFADLVDTSKAVPVGAGAAAGRGAGGRGAGRDVDVALDEEPQQEALDKRQQLLVMGESRTEDYMCLNSSEPASGSWVTTVTTWTGLAEPLWR